MLALPFQRYHLVCYSKANYTVTNKPSQGAFLGAVGDRLHRHRQAFPWHPSQNTKGQTTLYNGRQAFLYLRLHQRTDYTKTDEFSSPRAPGDRLPRQISPPLEFVSKHLGTDYMKKTNWLKADQQFSPPLGLL